MDAGHPVGFCKFSQKIHAETRSRGGFFFSATPRLRVQFFLGSSRRHLVGPQSRAMTPVVYAAPCKPCMMVRLTWISGSSEAPSRVTEREYFAIHRDSETILARTSCGSWLRSSMQSAASVRHSFLFQSTASTSGEPDCLFLCASISAPVTWPNSLYSVVRESSVMRCVFL